MRRAISRAQAALNKSEAERLKAEAERLKVDAERERLDKTRLAVESQLVVEVAARKSAEDQLISARSTVEQQNSELESHVARIRTLETRIEELEAKIEALTALGARAAEPERSSSQAERTGRAATPPGADNLRKIRGIGPAFARALNARGVLHFAQIAAWTEADISEVASALRIQVTRIHKEDWVGRAKALLSAGSAPE